MENEWLNALLGGILIGTAVSLMLLWNGRVTGISGIIYGLLKPTRGDIAWRIHFVLGLFAGGLVLHFLESGLPGNTVAAYDWTVALAGLLVGFGTVLGSGCTSGHGVCGISRLSPRSLLATGLFIATGVICVLVFKKIGFLI